MGGSLTGRTTSVRDDWRSWLASSKDEAYQTCKADLLACYSMLSVALNEAFELLNARLSYQASQAVSVTPGLCGRLGVTIGALLHQMGEHAKHYGIVPNAVPLDPANFQGARSQRAARFNSLLSHVLLTQRSQFLYKISVLEDLVPEIQREFCSAADELAAGASLERRPLWKSLDISHFDLNTCLQETIVLLKCFFVILPEEQVPVFENAFSVLRRRALNESAHRVFVLGARRAASVAGK